MEPVHIRFSVFELEDLLDLLGEIRTYIDPNLSLRQVLRAVHKWAMRRVRTGRLNPDALRQSLLESFVDEVMEELPTDEILDVLYGVDHAAVVRVAREARRRYARLAEAPRDRPQTRALLARIFVRKAIDDWHRGGVHFFANRWLRKLRPRVVSAPPRPDTTQLDGG